VLDITMAVALANTSVFTPYEVATWKDIPASQKEVNGLWFEGYGGYMSIGYDSAKVLKITSLQDLNGIAFKWKVALSGDSTKANAALNAVMMASLANGGSLDNIGPGVDFFSTLSKSGNFAPAPGTTATVNNGTTPVVFDWDYLSQAHGTDVPTWKVFVPANAVLGGYFAQAINKNAPQSGSGPAVGGVPLLRRRPEPVAQGRSSAGPDGRHDQGRHARQGRRGGAAASGWQATVPELRPGDRGEDLPGQPLGPGHRLSSDPSPVVKAAGPARFGRPVEPSLLDRPAANRA
jgi:hypothetical protein